MTKKITCFKAYDARGKVPSELNTDIAYRVGRAYAAFIKPKQVAIGRDARLTSDSLFEALSNGLMDSGVDVFDLGLCGTEAVYFAAFHLQLDGGIMITASHNPADYNGFKFVQHAARPISSDSGLIDICRLAEEDAFPPTDIRGKISFLDLRTEYIDHLLSYQSDRDQLKPLKIVANSGNGVSGPIIDLLEKHLPFEFIKVQHEPDGTFPNGVPNPLLPEGRTATIEAIKEHKADLGIAWDGDFDRCFLFDENGRFIEGYYIVGLLASALLKTNSGALVVHDPRLTWNTIELVEEAGGRTVQSKSGHAFIKETMREVNAAYGGEMSAHHYFREFGYCDSGMIPWLLLTQIMGSKNKSLAELVNERIEKFPVSGEINVEVSNTATVIAEVKSHFGTAQHTLDEMDGIGMDFGTWRFNLRSSNTEPLLRLNVESRGDHMLMEQKRDELLEIINR
jgi:phosphomannomutase/phosphomannomutase/phosphoglucomutase